MANFAIDKVIMYYDEVQLAVVYELGVYDGWSGNHYLACQSCDEGVFLATLMSPNQWDDLRNNRIDVRSVMTNPHDNEMFILIYPELGSDYIKNNTGIEFYYGFKVDKFNPGFFDWVIPESGLYYGQA